MFQAFMDTLVLTLQRIDELKYIRNVILDHIDSPNSIDVMVTLPDPDLGDVLDLILPVYAPEVPPAGLTDDYLPLRKQPLIVTLNPRIIVPAPSNENYDPTIVALACVHTLSFTDGALPEFMGMEHDIPEPSNGPADPAFIWVTYRLDTLKLVRVGPISNPAGMEVQLRVEGNLWLHPPTAPTPLPITEIRPPAQPEPPGTEIPRGIDEIVRLTDDN